AMYDRVIDIAFEPHTRELPSHPRVERIVQEQVCQHGRDRGSLRSAPVSLLQVPSGNWTGACSHRRTYSITHGRSVLAPTALSISSQETLSKNFWMSKSITQSAFQQRCRHAPTASNAERPGR